MTVYCTFWVTVALTILSVILAWDSNNSPGKTVVVMVIPEYNNAYYALVYDSIILFQAEYARRITETGIDNVVIITDNQGREALLAEEVPDDVIATPDHGQMIHDIWVRDYGFVGVKQQVRYKFEPNYLNLTLARGIQNSLVIYFASKNIHPKTTADLVIDGGNVVYNGIQGGGAILTSRIYIDPYNQVNSDAGKQDIRTILSQSLDYSKIIVVDQIVGDTTGHSDGLVSFISDDTVAISDLESNLYNAIYGKVINAGFNSVHLNSSWQPEVWNGFGSACGLHDLLATPTALYVPTFGGDQANIDSGQSLAKDIEIVDEIKKHTSKTVVEIPVPWDVCKMGRSVRFLTMAMDGTNADKLIQASHNDNPPPNPGA